MCGEPDSLRVWFATHLSESMECGSLYAFELKEKCPTLDGQLAVLSVLAPVVLVARRGLSFLVSQGDDDGAGAGSGPQFRTDDAAGAGSGPQGDDDGIDFLNSSGELPVSDMRAK